MKSAFEQAIENYAIEEKWRDECVFERQILFEKINIKASYTTLTITVGGVMLHRRSPIRRHK